MTRPFVAGLVLAAGASTRLGQPKQVLPFGGTTMLGRVIAEACAATELDQVNTSYRTKIYPLKVGGRNIYR